MTKCLFCGLFEHTGACCSTQEFPSLEVSHLSSLKQLLRAADSSTVIQLVQGGGRGWRSSPKLQVNAVSQFRDIKSQADELEEKSFRVQK